MTWPDGGSTPFKGEKATNWEGAFRVPMAIRWPGVIKPHTTYKDVFAHEDLLPTFAAAGGDLDVVERCKRGCQSGIKSAGRLVQQFDCDHFCDQTLREEKGKNGDA